MCVHHPQERRGVGEISPLFSNFPLSRLHGGYCVYNRMQAERTWGNSWQALGTQGETQREGGRKREGTPLHLLWNSLCLDRPPFPSSDSTLSSLLCGEVQEREALMRGASGGEPLCNRRNPGISWEFIPRTSTHFYGFHWLGEGEERSHGWPWLILYSFFSPPPHP